MISRPDRAAHEEAVEGSLRDPRVFRGENQRLMLRRTARWAVAIAIFLAAGTVGAVRAEMDCRRLREGFPLFFAPPEWHRDLLVRESLLHGGAGLLLSGSYLLVSQWMKGRLERGKPQGGRG